MKRFALLCFMPFLCPVLIAQEVEFPDEFGIDGSTTPCCAEEPQFRSGGTGCMTTPLYRGKPYAPLFIPNENDSIMTVRLNLIFVQKNDGSGNFQENNTEHQTLFDDIMDTLNYKMSALVYPDSTCFIGSPDDMVYDTRIRFVDHRYYVRRSDFWDNGLSYSANHAHLCPNSTTWYLNNLDDSLNNVVFSDTLRAINVYFTEDATVYHHYWEVQDLTDTTSLWSGDCDKGCSEPPSYTNLHAPARIHMPCRYSKFWWMKYIVPQLKRHNYPSWEEKTRSWLIWSIAKGLAHEIGHSFYLLHPNDRLEYNNPYFSYPTTTCSASIMQQSMTVRNFLPPNEIGLIYLSAMLTNMQQVIPTDTYLGSKTWNTTITLPRQMRMYHSLIIGASGNLTVPCNLTFSPQCNITIENGGVLTVDGATLQSVRENWGGIVVKSGGQLILSDAEIYNCNIVVESGGSLIIQNDLTIAGDHSITVESGGYLCVATNAYIELVDAFTTIIVSPNAILGCPSCNATCITTRSGLTNVGNGRFITYEGTSYLQKITISSDYLATGNIVKAGHHVTSTKPVGNVVVENGGDLRIKASSVTLDTGTRVKLGGKLTVSQ